ncbi:uncharacterized protein LOC127043551 [Gopherus flavomarginatus]|uniref:uncharacterized protein LOC127043551 n=1 Tax=Gopherus flavomarginatus TaxID=286002 RepID=UPI0021CBC921|nr:uncharacterized protein LOC127043551 [Gopherus flavomarginatus]
MPPSPKRAPAWNTSELQDLISVWGEEAVQSQLRSSRRNYDTYGQISKSLLQRGHEWDALQCRVKVKELWSAYCKAREGNRRSGAAPTTCRFYKELDAILGCDPSANPRSTMESSEQGEVGEDVEEAESEATGVEGDTPESQEACSQELFSSQEEASQSQQLELVGEEEAEERVPVPLNPPALSQPAQRLQNLRNKPRKSKEDLVKAVMNQYARESKRLQNWREKMHDTKIGYKPERDNNILTESSMSPTQGHLHCPNSMCIRDYTDENKRTTPQNGLDPCKQEKRDLLLKRFPAVVEADGQ